MLRKHRVSEHGNDKLFCVIARFTAMSFPCLTRESNTRDLRVKPEDDREANSLMANWLYCVRDGKGAKRPPQRQRTRPKIKGEDYAAKPDFWKRANFVLKLLQLLPRNYPMFENRSTAFVKLSIVLSASPC